MLYRIEKIIVKDNQKDKVLSPQLKSPETVSSMKEDRNLSKPTAIERYRRGLKPVVETKIVPHLPNNLRPIYYQFLEESKVTSPYRYVNLESNGPITNNIRKPRDKEILWEYPKLKMLIKGAKTPQQPLNINNSLTEETSQTFKFPSERMSINHQEHPTIDCTWNIKMKKLLNQKIHLGKTLSKYYRLYLENTTFKVQPFNLQTPRKSFVQIPSYTRTHPKQK